MRWETIEPQIRAFHHNTRVRIVHGDRTWVLPGVLKFGPHKWTWVPIAFRPPRQGEYFVSGAIPETYQHHGEKELLTPYLILKPRQMVRTVEYYTTGPRIDQGWTDGGE